MSLSIRKAQQTNATKEGIEPAGLSLVDSKALTTADGRRDVPAHYEPGSATRESPGGNASVHFSRATVEWSTSQPMFNALSWTFGGFDLDPCATPENAKCERFFTRDEDGLTQPWHGKVFLNPPYGRTIGKWVKKAYEESLKGALVVCLLPARVDTAWWHDYVRKGHVYFVRGRLKFGDAKNAAPFPSAVVIFGKFFTSDISLFSARCQRPAVVAARQQ